MKIEHKMLHDLTRAIESVGFVIMAETKGLYGYKEETEWVEIQGVTRKSGSTYNTCLSARRPKTKGFHPIALSWFTGNVGLERHEKKA